MTVYVVSGKLGKAQREIIFHKRVMVRTFLLFLKWIAGKMGKNVEIVVLFSGAETVSKQDAKGCIKISRCITEKCLK